MVSQDLKRGTLLRRALCRAAGSAVIAAVVAVTTPQPLAATAQRDAVAAPAPSPKSSLATSKPVRRRPERARKGVRKRTRAYPVSWTSPITASALAADLSALVPGNLRGRWGAMVVSLTRGDTLWHLQPGASMLPASTMKLFTSALALDRFGSAYQFRTEAMRDGVLGPDGVLTGNLVLRGDGDPSLSPRLFGGSPDGPMTQLAREVAASGIKRITGDIVADGSVSRPHKPDAFFFATRHYAPHAQGAQRGSA